MTSEDVPAVQPSFTQTCDLISNKMLIIHQQGEETYLEGVLRRGGHINDMSIVGSLANEKDCNHF